jgi:hypothetical protein
VARQGPSKSCDFGTPPSYLHWLSSPASLRSVSPRQAAAAASFDIYCWFCCCCLCHAKFCVVGRWFSVVPCGAILLAAVVAVVVQKECL